ncbi:MAG: tail fiber domain-containing protein [Salinibacter sp.]
MLRFSLKLMVVLAPVTRMSTVVLLLLGLGLLAGPALAQTPITTIENGQDDRRLEVSHNGGFVVSGTLVDDGTENDSILVEGDGERMLWYPEKAAFRAGEASGQWDASEIGTHSIALGRSTLASEPGATALGRETEASGLNSLAIGNGAVASGSYSAAFGNDTEASGFYSVAHGNYTVAATSHSFSTGQCNSSNTSSDNTLFVVGNGGGNATGCDTREDAFVLDEYGNLEIAGSLTENSDRRLKTGVESLGDGTLKALADIRPVRFQFKDEGTHPSGEQIGVIAQEVQDEFPELVSEGSDGTLSVAYPKLSAVLLKGVQEQQEEIDQRDAELSRQQEIISDLKAENEDIKDRLASLEADQSDQTLAGGTGPWGLALLLGLGLVGSLFWRRGPK